MSEKHRLKGLGLENARHRRAVSDLLFDQAKHRRHLLSVLN
ncbi:hypothetical protein [Pseudoruegeria sp. HB172150]|nr:hypothetical protein [Pseudoruegeria sp. HB172150]